MYLAGVREWLKFRYTTALGRTEAVHVLLQYRRLGCSAFLSLDTVHAFALVSSPCSVFISCLS